MDYKFQISQDLENNARIAMLSSVIAAMYANVKRLLQSAERTNCVRLTSLALRPLHFRPVVRALHYQNSLKQLELPGNASFIVRSALSYHCCGFDQRALY